MKNLGVDTSFRYIFNSLTKGKLNIFLTEINTYIGNNLDFCIPFKYKKIQMPIELTGIWIFF